MLLVLLKKLTNFSSSSSSSLEAELVATFEVNVLLVCLSIGLHEKRRRKLKRPLVVEPLRLHQDFYVSWRNKIFKESYAL